MYEEKARENLSTSTGGFSPQPLPKSAKAENGDISINTRKELAKIAGVSHDTYHKGVKILNSDNEEVKKQVLSGEKKINTAYNELFGKESKSWTTQF